MMAERGKSRMTSKIGRNVYVDVLALMILGTYISEQLFFLVSCAYLFYLILNNGMKLIVPRVPGFRLYIIVILYSALIGLFLYSTRSVVRDLYYVLPTIVWIFIGGYIAHYDCRKQKDFFETLFLYGGFISIKILIEFAFNFSIDFDNLRAIFGQNIYDVGFIMPIALIQMLFYGRVYISKKLDRFILLLMTLQIIFSFGRIAILQPLLFILTAMFVVIKSTNYRSKTLKRILTLLSTIIMIFVIGVYVIPDSVLSTFIDKILKTLQEIDAQQEIVSVTSAMNNWRGYEIQAAQNQWKSSTMVVQIFGNGMGKGIEIQYIPSGWEDMVVNDEIPLLHNGFYTILIKGGLFGLSALIILLVYPFIKGIKLSKTHKDNGVDCILTGLSIAAIANTYVVRGPIQQGCFMIWALIIGWLFRKAGITN